MATLSSIIAPNNVTTATNTQTMTNKTLTSPVLTTPNLGTPSSGTVTNLTGTASININGTVGATTPAAGTFTSLSDSGNLTFTGTGNRITGDFSNATVANRVMFQTSTTNGVTAIGVLPNGTATATLLDVYNNSDLTNASRLRINADNSTAYIDSGRFGTGTYLPMTFYTGGSERMRIDTSGNLLFNSGYGSVATAYGCRAWVNFNGTTASPSTIRGSGNVTSVTKNGTGDYTVNFATTLVDANYAAVGSAQGAAAAGGTYVVGMYTGVAASQRVAVCRNDENVTTPTDVAAIHISIFR